MKKLITICSMIAFFGSGYVIAADPVFIGGSSVSPPPFMVNSFGWMSTSVERACQFTVVPGGPYYVEKLEVPVFITITWPPLLASAYFTINPDDAGKPGQSIASFELDSITDTQQILVAEATQSAILNSGSLYWLVGVGGTPKVDVCWNLDSVNAGFWSNCAYRVNKGEWTVFRAKNVEAFAILGSPVPEPATLLLFGLGAVMMRKKR